MSAAPKDGRRGIIDEIEETAIAVILGLMTAITFINVVARYIFNSNILWALELTVFLFAWLVLLGVSYAVKKTAHLGVDAVTNLLSPELRRALALVSVACCIAYSLLLLKGSWDYWWKFATTASFLEVNDIPMPGFLQFFADWLNDGERYEKVPRYIPYAVLPVGMALLTLRFAQAGLRVWRGERQSIIASHEAEEMVEEAAARAREGN